MRIRTALTALFATAAIAAAEDEAVPRYEFDPIVVTATREPESIMAVPASISVVDQPEIQDARATVSLAEPLNRIPGVFVQDSGNYAQDVRIQIRGFGTRSAFGIREIKVLVDGLPETLPDGQTQLDGLDLDAIRRIEVLRGAASSLYGNASGGVIQFFTEDGPDTPQAKLRLTGGSYGLGKVEVKGGGRAGDARLFVSGSYFHVDGYRDHSASQTGVVNAKLRWDPSPTTTATFLLNYYDSPEGQDPGGLTTAEVQASRRQARALNAALDAGEEVQQVRAGATASHSIGDSEISGYGYVLYRDFDNRLPIPAQAGDGIVTFQRLSPGGGGRYTYRGAVAGWQQQLSVGLDAQYQEDDRRRFANDAGQRGALGLQQQERVTGFGAYLREAVYLTSDVEVSAGVRYDVVHFAVDADFPPDAADSGSRTFDALSPAGGVVWSPAHGLSLFANAGTAFQVPTTTELANPDGAGFNPDLEPQTALSFELGGRIERSDLSAGAALYHIDIRDELIAFESDSGRTAFRNAGRSRRYGLELDGSVELLPGLRWNSAVTLINARFTDYTTATGSFDGNREPGIPPWQVYQELAYRHPSGLFAALEAFFVGGYYVNDANTDRSRGYPVVNLRLGYDRDLWGFGVSPFVGFNNLTDARYDGTVRLNALGGRYYEPAAGFNVYGGIGVTAFL